MNSDTRKILLGALVGTARAAENSAHLFDRSLDQYMIKTVAACGDPSVTDAEALEMVQALNDEKEYLVPDCFMCAEPCGRIEDYDLDQMNEEMEPIIALKETIIEQTIAKAQELLLRGDDIESLLLFPFYRALYAIGASDWSEEDLQSVITEVNSL